MSKHISIFLASSAELKEDRDGFDAFVSRKSNLLRNYGISLEVVRWEHFLDVLSKTRLQDEYNKKIRNSDLFVMLFHMQGEQLRL